jgi:hypothetical protein
VGDRRPAGATVGKLEAVPAERPDRAMVSKAAPVGVRLSSLLMLYEVELLLLTLAKNLCRHGRTCSGHHVFDDARIEERGCP